MPRQALRAFFERIVVAALPLAMCACGGSGAHNADLAVMAQSDLSASAADLSDPFNPTVPPVDSCETGHPPVVVPVTLDELPDGGMDPECRTGAECIALCPAGYSICCGPNAVDAGAQTMTCTYDCGPTGRRPAGMAASATASAATDAGCGVGQYLASMAQLEAASVHAFRTLARQLVAHGAPSRLIARARAAARDEVRHARLTRRLARAHGLTSPPLTVDTTPLPSLETMAHDNAVEGCVRETFGALLAAWQARTAADGEIRALMRTIATDEAAHAELAWDLDSWLASRLDRAARARVTTARAEAVTALTTELSRPLPPLLVARAGLPTVAQAQTLLRETRAQLWS